MDSNLVKVGMREFRANLQQYLFTAAPVAITRHGETIGFYIPTRHHPEKAELDALKKAAIKLEKLLHEHGVSENELVTEFRALKRGRKR